MLYLSLINNQTGTSTSAHDPILYFKKDLAYSTLSSKDLQEETSGSTSKGSFFF